LFVFYWFLNFVWFIHDRIFRLFCTVWWTVRERSIQDCVWFSSLSTAMFLYFVYFLFCVFVYGF
jgi:hypothetical protein